MRSAVNGSAIDRLTRIGGSRFVREMIELFLANGAERVREVRAGADADDASRVERAAHALKSSAGNVGAERVGATAESLERSALAGMVDREAVARLESEFEDCARSLHDILEEQPS